MYFFNNAEHLGRAVAFPLRLNDRNRLAMVQADAAVRQSIYLIIFTVPGERVMRPNFGCRIHELIFDPANAQTAATAERYIREALEAWEPRITLEDVDVQPSSDELGELIVHLVYQLQDQPDPRSMVFPFYLNPNEEGE
jgi:phage baseplate assembly protein W